MLFSEIALIASSAGLLYSLFPEQKIAILALWPLIFFWCWLKWFFKTKLNIDFSLDLFRFVRHARIFSDSVRYLDIPKTLLPTLCLFGLSFLLVQPQFFFWLTVWTVSLALQIPRRKKNTEIPEYIWSFPTECSFQLDPKYPLLRHTFGFQGNKRFEISRGEKPHVIFIFLESFRAKNVGCLGGFPAASPQFDLLAEKGVLFTQFYANGLQTYRAMISSFFGIPAHLKTMSLEPFCSIPLIGLPEIMKENGYKTALFQGSPTTFDWTFPFLHRAGFETIRGQEDFFSERKTSWGITDEALFKEAADWLENQTTPTFLSLFTISNHHPWEAPHPFPTPDNLPEPYQRYLQTFAYTDACLGVFIERLKKSRLLEKSVVFILGDHGQEMGERKGSFAMHRDLYQENIHIPLLILSDQKLSIDEPASQVDLLPTVLDLLNLKATHHSVGRSLAREGAKPVFSSMLRQECLLVSLKEKMKLMLGRKEECYDLLKDPQEAIVLPVPKEMKQETESYFQSIERIFKRAAWAPPSLSLPSAILDLSHSFSTDQTLFDLTKEKGYFIHECNLSHSPFFTDAALQWLAANCPRLSILNISGCPLMTSQGIGSVLHQCSSLRSLNIEGNKEIDTLPIHKETALEALHLLNCPQLQGEALVQMGLYCPRLIYLATSFKELDNNDLHILSKHLNQIQYLVLENGLSISEKALNDFLSANSKLQILIIERFPHLSEIDLSRLKWMQTLKFLNCPNLNDETLTSLKHLKIRDLALVSCPKITIKGLREINPDCKVLIEDCAGIDTIAR